MQTIQYRNRSGNLVETVHWNGHTWRRYPESKHHSVRQYFRRTTRPESGKLQHFWLHKEVWKQKHGEIPEGHDIHHIDEDTTNNSIDNLQCLSKSDHSTLHIEHMHKAIEAAKPWHSSEEGRAWHRQHARKVADAQPFRKKTCQHCGVEYETKDARASARYCSSKCRSYARKQRCTDHEPRPCVVCGNHFVVDKYSKILTCSAPCKSVRMSQSAKKRRDRERIQHSH